MKTLLTLLLTFVFIALSACDGDSSESPFATAYDGYETAQDSQYEAEVVAETPAFAYDGRDRASEPTHTAITAQRKIIYNASVDLVVDAFEDVPSKVQALVQKHGGFIANSSIRGSEGEPRSGTWTLRIASAQYDAFLAGSKTLGQVRTVTTGTEEVTAEYVDLEARIRNLNTEEQRLLKHLQESTGKLDDILKVEREISRVRGEIERHKGRLNFLKDQVALSTVTLTVHEIKNYIPEATEEPGYTTQVARAWSNSIDAVGGFMTNLSLGVIGLVPWIAVLIPLVIFGYVITRVLRRSIKRSAKANPPKAVESARP